MTNHIQGLMEGGIGLLHFEATDLMGSILLMIQATLRLTKVLQKECIFFGHHHVAGAMNRSLSLPKITTNIIVSFIITNQSVPLILVIKVAEVQRLHKI